MAGRSGLVIAVLAVVALASCSSPGPTAPRSPAPTPPPVATPTAQASPSARSNDFPVELFAGLDYDPVTDPIAAQLQGVLDASADDHGLTATVITTHGTWSGATGMATTDRAMDPNDQLAIASIAKTILATQVMQLVEADKLGLDDLAADRLPPDIEFDTNGARIIDLLSMRSGIPEYDTEDESLERDPLHVWTAAENLAKTAPDRGPVGQDWEYSSTNYLLLRLIIEQVTGRSIAEVLRSGVTADGGFDRLIFQPDERPTEPFAVTDAFGASADTFDDWGGVLPSLSVVTGAGGGLGMASDAPSLARWFKAMCAGEFVSSASLSGMTDFVERPGYGLGVIDRSGEYWPGSGAFGHMGANNAVALCFQDPVGVVVVLANADHDVDTLAGDLVRAAATP